LRQVTGRQKIDSYAQQVFESNLEPAQIKERGARKRINQKVKVAVLVVASVQNRPEDARIACPAFLDQAANFVAMKVQSSGRLQGRYLVNGWSGRILLRDVRLRVASFHIV
jgi:hypothetical protein